jgi:carbamoyl-phosphate synthase large subunit
VPFVAKATGIPIAKLAARVMAGAKLDDFDLSPGGDNHIAIKEAVFPFARFPGVDTLLGPEMRSTGEVMGLDHDFAIAFAKSQLAAGEDVPKTGTAFISVKQADKERILHATGALVDLGFDLVATSGTQRYLSEQGLECARINKVLEGRPHIVDAIQNGAIQLVINTTEGGKAVSDSRSLRRAALMHKVPYFTTHAAANAAVRAITALSANTLDVRPLQDYVGKKA